MGADRKRTLIPSRGMLAAEDFCAASGLGLGDLIEAADLGVVEPLRREDGSIRGVFDDALPTGEQLRGLGMRVRSDYRPELLASSDGDDPGAGPDPALLEAEAERDRRLRYAIVERERRWLVAAIPDGLVEARHIVDRYLTGTRLRLREVVYADGRVERKLGHRVRLGEGAGEIAHTSCYLDDEEWTRLRVLPGLELAKTRHLVGRQGAHVVVDEHADGSLVAEIDDGPLSASAPPAWLDILEEVTGREEWTGHGLAVRLGTDTCGS